MSKKSLIDKDGEVRELTENELKKFRPISEVNPSLLAKIKKGIGERGVQKSPTKIPISIRVSPEVAEYFRSAGKGWQGRIDNILKDYVAHHK
ncbi:MAG: BrnA antitoxin family protein [Methylococcales symbiont of Hymedesmia sp. n. MRB-2018]|nr:MAG: BrnA antitoxin family protein [Methylococcales symbiont of Hymedesmia sp. n. MRB-2018]KAF3984550.1 MAG: BrnA antitoxin family protein [Methylococcales symbiont of Hymedesmia sp. n. MRB-2018]